MQLLAQWRELRARKRDKPRNWIVKDKQLLEIAKLRPSSLEDLKHIDDLGRHFLHHEGDEVLGVVKQALEISADLLPISLPKPLEGNEKQQLKNGQQFAEQKALELGLPTEMLIRKCWLISLLQNMRNLSKEDLEQNTDTVEFLPVELAGWRKPLLIPELMEAME